jgi:hypothetical protein
MNADWFDLQLVGQSQSIFLKLYLYLCSLHSLFTTSKKHLV